MRTIVIKRMQRVTSILLISMLLMSSCDTIKQSSKYTLKEGYYKSRIYHKKLKSVYLIPGEDSIRIYSAKKLSQKAVDTTKSLKLSFPAAGKPAEFVNYTFKQTGLDLDVLSILFKYRPSVKSFPNQFNTSVLNGAIYLGCRSDWYNLRYRQTPLRIFKRQITHYGFSYGVFTGLGSARIDEYVTQNALSIQYDGFVNLSGIAAIIAVDKLSFGVTGGFDHLLDKNKHLWLYQGKPWLGLSVGLNLN